MKAIIFALLLGTGCTGGGESSSDPIATHRFVDREGKYSLDAPDAWRASRERGSTVFVLPSSKQTVVVRSAPKPREMIEGRATTAEAVFDSTEQVLRALPNAALAKRWHFGAADMPAEAFVVTFKPRSTPGKTYQRTHVVLVGRERLFHVVYTTPLDEPFATDVLEGMVAGLREEV